LRRIYRLGPDEYLQIRGLLERPIIQILSDFPDILEEEASFIDSEVQIPSGRIDLLMEDVEDRILVIEVENLADDFAVGQVCRLASGYSSKFDLPKDSIRKIIICLRYSSTLPDTC